MIFLFCDSYKKWIEYKCTQETMNYEQKFFELEWNFYAMFCESFLS